MKVARTWTEEESRRLEQNVTQQQAEGNGQTIDWTQVADRVGTRNNKECRKRWYYVCSPGMSKGPWRAEEDDRLRAAIDTYGTRWAQVSRMVESRNPDQCSKRYNEVIRPKINKDRWSLLEDDILLKATRAHGRSWTEISERYFPERTPLRIRSRYFQLQKRAEGSSMDAQPDTTVHVQTPHLGDHPTFWGETSNGVCWPAHHA